MSAAQLEKWVRGTVSRETKLALEASTAARRANHAGIAAGILAAAGHTDADAVGRLVLGYSNRGEQLRAFAEGVRTGSIMAGAVIEVTG